MCVSRLLADNANTWHRSGLNISADRERAACLHAFTPEWVLPKHDQMTSFNNFVGAPHLCTHCFTSAFPCAHACWWFHAESGSYDRLNEREQADVRQLWIGKLTEQRSSLGSTVIEQQQQRRQRRQEEEQSAALSRL